MDDEEFANMLGNRNGDEGERRLLNDSRETVHGRALQATGEINWADTGHLTPVKDQGACGSCVAFCVSTAMEGMLSLKATAANGGVMVDPVRLSE